MYRGGDHQGKTKTNFSRMLPSVSLASSLRSLDRRHVSALYASLQTAVGSGQTVESLLPLRKVLLPLSHGSLAALQGCSREKLLLHFPSLSNNAIDVLHPWFQMKEDEILSFKSALVSLSVGNFLEVCALIVKQPNVSTLLSIYQEITTPFMLCTPSDTPEQEILSELWLKICGIRSGWEIWMMKVLTLNCSLPIQIQYQHRSMIL